MSRSAKQIERAAATESDPRWAAVLARSAAADGTFFYSVRTTGVYCRPSCAARLARPENIDFHSTGRGRRAAGFRPCKRCRPDQPPWRSSMPPRSPRPAVSSRRPPRPAQPRAIGPARRGERIPLPSDLQGDHRAHAESLCRGPSGQAGTQGAGPSRLGDGRDLRCGIQLQRPLLRRVGAGPGHDADRLTGPAAPDEEIRFAIGECSLGSILVAASERGVCAILLGRRSRRAGARSAGPVPACAADRRRSGFEQLVAKVVGLRRGAARSGSTCRSTSGAPRSSSGSGRRCARSRPALRRAIPTSPSASARRSAVRAVAQACAANNAGGGDPLPSRRAQRRRRCPAIAGAWSASARCSSGRRRMSA